MKTPQIPALPGMTPLGVLPLTGRQTYGYKGYTLISNGLQSRPRVDVYENRPNETLRFAHTFTSMDEAMRFIDREVKARSRRPRRAATARSMAMSAEWINPNAYRLGCEDAKRGVLLRDCPYHTRIECLAWRFGWHSLQDKKATRGAIKIVHVYPPIPLRHFDWLAYHDGEDESPWLHGTGSTKEEALEDLSRLDQERAEALQEENQR